MATRQSKFIDMFQEVDLDGSIIEVPVKKQDIEHDVKDTVIQELKDMITNLNLQIAALAAKQAQQATTDAMLVSSQSQIMSMIQSMKNTPAPVPVQVPVQAPAPAQVQVQTPAPAQSRTLAPRQPTTRASQPPTLSQTSTLETNVAMLNFIKLNVSPALKYKFSFEEEPSIWYQMNHSTHHGLNAAIAAGLQQYSFTLCNGCNYTIDLTTMTQTNTGTSVVRKIRMEEYGVHVVPLSFSYQDDNNTFIQYRHGLSKEICDAIRNGQTTYTSGCYIIDIIAMTQLNTTTNKLRKIAVF